MGVGERYEKGDIVEAQFTAGGRWYKGEIQSVCLTGGAKGDGVTYDVLFDDGDRDEHVPGDRIRHYKNRKKHFPTSSSPTMTKAMSTNHMFRVGMKIMGRYGTGARYYPGVIVATHPSGTYDIRYDDGDIEREKPLCDIKSQDDNRTNRANGLSGKQENFQVGSPVKARFQGQRKWYKGVIAKVQGGGMYDVNYLDGDVEKGVREDLIQLDEPAGGGSGGVSGVSGRGSGGVSGGGSVGPGGEDMMELEDALSVGERVQVRLMGQWWPGRVVRIPQRGRGGRGGGGAGVDVLLEHTQEVEVAIPREYIRKMGGEGGEEVEERGGVKYRHGDRVEGRYGGGEVWYPGEVRALHADGSVDVYYDDGDIERCVRPDFIRREGGGETGREAGGEGEGEKGGAGLRDLEEDILPSIRHYLHHKFVQWGGNNEALRSLFDGLRGGGGRGRGGRGQDISPGCLNELLPTEFRRGLCDIGYELSEEEVRLVWAHVGVRDGGGMNFMEFLDLVELEGEGGEGGGGISSEDRRTDGRTVGRTDGRTDTRTDGRTDTRADGRTDGRTDTRTDARTDTQTAPKHESPPRSRHLFDPIAPLYPHDTVQVLTHPSSPSHPSPPHGTLVAYEPMDDTYTVQYTNHMIQTHLPRRCIRLVGGATGRGGWEVGKGVECVYNGSVLRGTIVRVRYNNTFDVKFLRRGGEEGGEGGEDIEIGLLYDFVRPMMNTPSPRILFKPFEQATAWGAHIPYHSSCSPRHDQMERVPERILSVGDRVQLLQTTNPIKITHYTTGRGPPTTGVISDVYRNGTGGGMAYDIDFDTGEVGLCVSGKDIQFLPQRPPTTPSPPLMISTHTPTRIEEGGWEGGGELRKYQSYKIPTMTPSTPTPSAPTPSAPTPSAPTPSAPIPSTPTPSAPTPSIPTHTSRPTPITPPLTQGRGGVGWVGGGSTSPSPDRLYLTRAVVPGGEGESSFTGGAGGPPLSQLVMGPGGEQGGGQGGEDQFDPLPSLTPPPPITHPTPTTSPPQEIQTASSLLPPSQSSNSPPRTTLPTPGSKRKCSMTLSGQLLSLLNVGERVKARLGGGPRYYTATITQVRFSGKAYDVRYDDGQVEKMVKRELLKPFDEVVEGGGDRPVSLEALASW